MSAVCGGYTPAGVLFRLARRPVPRPMCPMCTEPMGDDAVRLEPCGHRLHADCAHSWFVKHGANTLRVTEQRESSRGPWLRAASHERDEAIRAASRDWIADVFSLNNTPAGVYSPQTADPDMFMNNNN